MNMKKLIKWSFVLAALLAFKNIAEPTSQTDNKPVYISTQKSGR